MSIKVFIVGLPGSGKSAVAHYISMLARDKGFTVKSFNDYDILHGWFKNAPDGPQFSRTAHNGFDVHDLSVFDTSLLESEKLVLQNVTSTEKELILIEFARADYCHAFSQFSAAFLQDAYFLFIDAEIPVCKERVRKRYLNRSSSDDHYVSDYIFDTYYIAGRKYCTANELNELRDNTGETYSLNAQRMKVVYNGATSLWATLNTEIAHDILQILEQKDLAPPQVETPLEVEHTNSHHAGVSQN